MKELGWEWVEVTTSSDMVVGHSWQGPFFFRNNTSLFRKLSFVCFGYKNSKFDTPFGPPGYS